MEIEWRYCGTAYCRNCFGSRVYGYVHQGSKKLKATVNADKAELLKKLLDLYEGSLGRKALGFYIS
ncbi:MAG: hypothetical protein PHE06_03630 [Lachnospiraceae bacterium]|nr:hypothetical protein [Lachnospiraceae bacterium]MDD3795055.1 hypothetical protein [Lachnospiraceae bacterium]